MKADIHPTYYKEAKVTCSCGSTFTVGSTMPVISVEICGNCHPFYTGQEKIIDTAGRVEKFKVRAAAKKEAPKKDKKTKTRAIKGVA
ncbi:MAG: 50S ribosomal protein L31 [bacterium]|nr:50S ribosomal protein L31 [bacterium]